MKKLIVTLLVLALSFAIVIPASAGGYGPGGGGSGGGSGGGNGGGNGSGTGTGTGLNTSTGQGQPNMRGTFAITGTLASISGNTVTINVLRGNKLVQPYLGTTLAVTVTSQTRFLYKDGTTTTAIGIADLKVGQPVSLNGTLANDLWNVTRLTVGASLTCLP